MNAFGISVAAEEFQRIIDENLGGLESVKAIVDDILIWGEDDSFEEATASHDKKLLAFLKRFQRGIISNLIKRSSGWRRLNCSTCIWVWPNRQRIYTWPQETRLYCVHTCPNQQRWIEKITWWCYLPLTFSEDFLTKSEPLRALLKNSNAFIWE